MTNEEAILRLGRDMDDEAALIAVAENNLGMLKAAVERYFSGRTTRRKAFLTLLVHISWHAKEFVQGEDADRFIGAYADEECRRLQSKVRCVTAGEEVHQRGERAGKRELQCKTKDCISKNVTIPEGGAELHAFWDAGFPKRSEI